MINTYANVMRLAKELEQEQTSHSKTRKLLLEACEERDDAEHFTGNRIRTSFVNPPLPIRHFDWVAWIDGDEETGLAGNGKTEQEAIDELIALQMVYDESNANTEASQ